MFAFINARRNKLKILVWGVPRTPETTVRRCCGEDEGRSLEAAVQREASNRPLLRCSKVNVVSKRDKAWCYHVR